MHFSILRGVSFYNSGLQEGFSIFFKNFYTLIREFLYADDINFLAHAVNDMQPVMGLFADSYTAFGVKISLTKTKVMFTHVTGELSLIITVHGNSSAVDATFICEVLINN